MIKLKSFLGMNVTKNKNMDNIKKPILDACCGGRMFYFDKSDERKHGENKQIIKVT